MSTEPVAEYRETRFDGPRRYSLFRDYLLVSGRETFRSDFEIRIPLASLHPDYSRAGVRNRLFWFGLLLTVVAGIAVMQRATASDGLRYDEFRDVLWLSLLAAGCLVSSVTWRKTRHVFFVNQSGQSVIGLVERGDPQFATFVKTLAEQIRTANEARRT